MRMTRQCLSVCLTGAVLVAVACGGGPAEPPASPEPPAAAPSAAEPVPEPEPAPEPEPEPEAPKQVSISEVEINGEGLTEEAVRKAFDAVSPQYETCYAKALETTPDAKGRLSVTLLYVKGERKSVAASYAGPGAAEINACFQKASTELELSPPADSDRVSVYLRLLLEPAPTP